MKKHTLIILAFLFISLSCDKNDDIFENKISKNGFSYNQSLNQWNQMIKTNGNSYIYKTTFVSWVGFGSTTELKIINGVVIARNYQEFELNESTGQHEIIETFSENFEDLNSHPKGAVPQTIDQLYNSCAGKYLIADKKNNTIIFETEENGLMTLCGFVPNNCADDCFIGVSIDSFEWID